MLLPKYVEGPIVNVEVQKQSDMSGSLQMVIVEQSGGHWLRNQYGMIFQQCKGLYSVVFLDRGSISHISIESHGLSPSGKVQDFVSCIHAVKETGAAVASMGVIVGQLLLLVLLFGAAVSMSGGDTTAAQPVSAEVLAYEPFIRQYALKYGIGEYVELIKAVMMQESGSDAEFRGAF